MNDFSKQEAEAFDEVLKGYSDALVMSELVSVYNTNMTEMERSSDTIWRPVPYIAQSKQGSDATNDFTDATQLSVPSTISIQHRSTANLSAKEMRDLLQEQRLGEAALQKLASDVNVAVLNVISNQGTICIDRSTSPTGFDDVAEIDATLNELGVPMDGRCLALSSRNYNSMANNLQARQTMNEIPTKAYRKAYVGEVSNIETFKLDYSKNLTAATASGVTINGASQNYTPRSTMIDMNGGQSNVDNRYQNIQLTVGSGTVKVGDCFISAGVNSVHHITKEDTGQPKTFRIVKVLSGNGGSGTFVISPPIVCDDQTDASDADRAYKNVTATPANGAAVTFLNIADARINPFWCKGSVELLPASLGITQKETKDAGAKILRATTDNGIEVVMQKEYNILTQKTFYRWDVLFGVVNLQPEMNGLILFNQS